MVWTDEIVAEKSPEELVEMQLQEWAQTDAALAEKLDLAKIGDCWDWITDEVRKQSPGKSAAVWHGKIFRMARDYFVDGVAASSAASAPAPEPKRKPRKKHAPRDLDDPKAQEPTPAPLPAPEPAPAPVASTAPGLQQLDLFAEAQA